MYYRISKENKKVEKPLSIRDYIQLQFSHVLYILLIQIHFTETKQLMSYKSTLSMDLLFKEHLLGYTV